MNKKASITVFLKYNRRQRSFPILPQFFSFFTAEDIFEQVLTRTTSSLNNFKINGICPQALHVNNRYRKNKYIYVSVAILVNT